MCSLYTSIKNGATSIDDRSLWIEKHDVASYFTYINDSAANFSNQLGIYPYLETLLPTN